MKRRQFLRGTFAMIACGFFARRLSNEVEEEVEPNIVSLTVSGFGLKRAGLDHRGFMVVYPPYGEGSLEYIVRDTGVNYRQRLVAVPRDPAFCQYTKP